MFSVLLFLALLPARSPCQPASEVSYLKQKARLFKNRVLYDSAFYYYNELVRLSNQYGDKKQALLNQINLADVYLLQRDCQNAQHILEDVEVQIEQNFKGDTDLEADYYQVMGSYLIEMRSLNEARACLNNSIKIRSAKFGPGDTTLHYAYNKLGNLYIALSDFDSAYFFHKIALELSLKKQNKVNYLSASSYQNLGIAAHMKGDFKQAEECYTQSMRLKEELFENNDPALAKIYWNLGKFFTDLNNYDVALLYYDKSEQLLASRYDRDDIQFGHVYWNKGNVYTLKGDYIKATSYLTKAYSIFAKNLDPEDQAVLKSLTDLGFAYDKKGDKQLAIEYYFQASKNKDNAGIIKIYRNLGNIYQNINEPDSADKYYRLSIDYAKGFFKGNSHDLALCYQYYGDFLSTTDHPEKSLGYYTEAEKILRQLFGRKNKDLSNVLGLESRYYMSEKNYKAALFKIQESLVALLPSFENTNPMVNPSVEEIIIDLYLPNTLSYKASALKENFTLSNDINDLLVSLQTIHLTLEIIEQIRKTYIEEESQLILNKQARALIGLGVIVTQTLYSETGDEKFISEAFKFSEKGQSIILLSALRGLQAESTMEIPRNAQDYENNLTRELATYNNLLYQEKQKKVPDDAKIILWRDILFNLQLSYDSLLSDYEKLYPDYFRLKYDYSVISPDSVLKWLPEDQAILEYHFTDSLLFGFLLTDHKMEIIKCGQKHIILEKLDSLLKHFIRQDYFNAGQKQLESIIHYSTDLYDTLISPFETEIGGKRLIIIPDDKLGYLSFDLLLNKKLLTASWNYSELPWLIKYNPISYSSSATIYFEQTNSKRRETKSDLLAFAPSYDFHNRTRDAGDIDSAMLRLSPITGTKEEIHAIAGQFRTKKRFDDDATEDYFKKHAGDYGILHLAMHTIIDNQNPLYSKLVFSPSGKGSQEDGYLNTYELFRIKLPGQLAVLSACNTGGGKLERGEGIISLARGFFYAGIPSVLMTLWEIEDHSSANLMALFYENLKKGQPYDIALQQAKISYIESAGKLQSHPYFWAGYVSIGKTSPMEFSMFWSPILIAVLISTILVICILVFFFIRNRVFLHQKRY